MCLRGWILVLPSNWFPLTRVKWLPLIANLFAVSGIVNAEPGVGATTWSAAHMGLSSIGSYFIKIQESDEVVDVVDNSSGTFGFQVVQGIRSSVQHNQNRK
ncbi:hypothetical protein Tco_0365572 [Tanacetum coccineum]